MLCDVCNSVYHKLKLNKMKTRIIFGKDFDWKLEKRIYLSKKIFFFFFFFFFFFNRKSYNRILS